MTIVYSEDKTKTETQPDGALEKLIKRLTKELYLEHPCPGFSILNCFLFWKSLFAFLYFLIDLIFFLTIFLNLVLLPGSPYRNLFIKPNIEGYLPDQTEDD